jgi:hypothetical protein
MTCGAFSWERLVCRLDSELASEGLAHRFESCPVRQSRTEVRTPASNSPDVTVAVASRASV